MVSHVASKMTARPRINDWWIADGGSGRCVAPELRPIKLMGTVSNHPTLEDALITTSLVQMIDQSRGIAQTLSTEYELGTPSVACAARLATLVAPLMYNNERVQRVAEQLACKAARARLLPAAQDDVQASETVASVPPLVSRPCAVSAPTLRHPCTASAPPLCSPCARTATPHLHRCCTVSAPPLRRFCNTAASPLRRHCAATARRWSD